jgi:hypothetical protein
LPDDPIRAADVVIGRKRVIFCGYLFDGEADATPSSRPPTSRTWISWRTDDMGLDDLDRDIVDKAIDVWKEVREQSARALKAKALLSPPVGKGIDIGPASHTGNNVLPSSRPVVGPGRVREFVPANSSGSSSGLHHHGRNFTSVGTPTARRATPCVKTQGALTVQRDQFPEVSNAMDLFGRGTISTDTLKQDGAELFEALKHGGICKHCLRVVPNTLRDNLKDLIARG